MSTVIITTPTATTTTISTPPTPSAITPCTTANTERTLPSIKIVSSEKIRRSNLKLVSPIKTRRKRLEENVKSSTYKLFDVTLLQDCSTNSAVCKQCRKSSGLLELVEVSSQRKGLASQFLLRCKNCESNTNFSTSKKTGLSTRYDSLEVNVRSAYASQTLGHTGLLFIDDNDIDVFMLYNKLVFDGILKQYSCFACLLTFVICN